MGGQLTATRFERLTEEFDAGTRCILCRMPVTDKNCPCNRQRLYADRQEEVTTWWEGLPEKVRNGLQNDPRTGRKFKVTPSVLSAMSGERFKTGLTDLPLDPNDPQGPSVSTDERQGLERQLGVDPSKAKWQKGQLGRERQPARKSPGVNPPTAGGLGGRASYPTRTIVR